MTTRGIAGVLLAAGKGTRMQSDLPKVLHPLADRPLVSYPIAAARAAGVEHLVVVVGYCAQDVQTAIEGLETCPRSTVFALQREQLGTGHAVSMALPQLREHTGPVLILSGDVPLIRSQTLTALVRACRDSPAGLSLVTFRPSEPGHYGRIVRGPEGGVAEIREYRDATPEQREIRECNAGVYCVDAELLREVLPQLGSDNAQGEIYLTDLVAMAARRGSVAVIGVEPLEVSGVNTREQLAQLAEHVST